MVIAINTERSSNLFVRSEVHFKASLLAPGVSVGYCIRSYNSCISFFGRVATVTFFTPSPPNRLSDRRPLTVSSLLPIFRFAIQEHAPWCSYDQAFVTMPMIISVCLHGKGRQRGMGPWMPHPRCRQNRRRLRRLRPCETRCPKPLVCAVKMWFRNRAFLRIFLRGENGV